MVSEFISEKINTAHQLIDEGRFDEAVGMMKNLKLRIHDKDAEEQIKKFESERDLKIELKLKEINESNEDSLRKDANQLQEWALYAKDYLNYYDKLTKKYDV